MLVACRLAGLSALGAHYAGVRVGAQTWAACGCAAQLGRLAQMAAKSTRMAANSKPVSAAPLTSLGNPFRRVRRTVAPQPSPDRSTLKLWDRELSPASHCGCRMAMAALWTSPRCAS